MKKIAFLLVLSLFSLSVCETLLSAPVTRAEIVDDQSDYPIFNAPTMNLQLLQNGQPFVPASSSGGTLNPDTVTARAFIGPMYHPFVAVGDSNFNIASVFDSLGDATIGYVGEPLSTPRVWSLPVVNSGESMLPVGRQVCFLLVDARGGINGENIIQLTVVDSGDAINGNLTYDIDAPYGRVKICVVRTVTNYFIVNQ